MSAPGQNVAQCGLRKMHCAAQGRGYRRADEDQPFEQVRRLVGGDHANHAADGVADEDHLSQVERADDLDQVVRVGVEGRLSISVVGRQIGCPSAYMIIDKGPELVLEGWSDETPHMLIAAETVSEHHCSRAN